MSKKWNLKSNSSTKKSNKHNILKHHHNNKHKQNNKNHPNSLPQIHSTTQINPQNQQPEESKSKIGKLISDRSIQILKKINNSIIKIIKIISSNLKKLSHHQIEVLISKILEWNIPSKYASLADPMLVNPHLLTNFYVTFYLIKRVIKNDCFRCTSYHKRCTHY